MRIKDKSLPGSIISRTDWVFVTSSQLETVRGEQSDSLPPACEAPYKMLPLQILCELQGIRGMDNKWNFNDFRRDFELFNIHES